MFYELGNKLSARTTPVTVFFRNDDGGWADAELDRLCDWFTTQKLPLDIACIPAALTPESVAMLMQWTDSPDSTVHLHQHGFAHTNHQPEGRGCEFGSARTLEEQHRDISRGRQILSDAFDGRIEPVFTPPWNRCTDATVKALEMEGFKYLSRIKGSLELRLGLTVTERDVSVDWLKKKKGDRLTGTKLIDYITAQIDSEDNVVGIMLHHEYMGRNEMDLLGELVETLRSLPQVSFGSLVETAEHLPE